MAFLVLMTWIMLMTSILLLVGLWDLLHHYENRRKERNKRAILWFRPFISKLLLPCLTIFLILFSIIWPAATFDMGDLIIDQNLRNHGNQGSAHFQLEQRHHGHPDGHCSQLLDILGEKYAA